MVGTDAGDDLLGLARLARLASGAPVGGECLTELGFGTKARARDGLVRSRDRAAAEKPVLADDRRHVLDRGERRPRSLEASKRPEEHERAGCAAVEIVEVIVGQLSHRTLEQGPLVRKDHRLEREIAEAREPFAPDLVTLRRRVLGVGLEPEPLEEELEAETPPRHVDRVLRFHRAVGSAGLPPAATSPAKERRLRLRLRLRLRDARFASWRATPTLLGSPMSVRRRSTAPAPATRAVTRRCLRPCETRSPRPSRPCSGTTGFLGPHSRSRARSARSAMTPLATAATPDTPTSDQPAMVRSGGPSDGLGCQSFAASATWISVSLFGGTSTDFSSAPKPSAATRTEWLPALSLTSATPP